MIRPTQIPALRLNNLVYVRNLKCASTFFYENFLHTLHWAPTNYKDIDWNDDHVFSHIIDPIKKRHKAVAELIDMKSLSYEFVNNKKLQELLITTPWLDRHGVSYFDLFGDSCLKIDWIPISSRKNDTIMHTEKLLQHYSVHINSDLWNYHYEHKSTALKKEVENILEKNWESASTYTPQHLTSSLTASELNYFKFDIELYNKIVDKFNPNGVDWLSTSWLRN